MYNLLSMSGAKWIHPPCSLGLATNSQQYFSLRTNQHQPSANYLVQTRRNLHVPNYLVQSLCTHKDTHRRDTSTTVDTTLY
jgi:hypothetical protein